MVFVEHNSLKSDIFLIPYLFHVFQDSCFSGSRFFRVQVFQSPDFSGSRFFWVQDFQGPGFSGSQFFRVQVQGPGPGFRKRFLTATFLKREKKALLWEKKHCYKKLGSDIYRKSNYATFFCNFAKISVFQQGVITVHSGNRLYIVLSVEKNHWK